MYMVGAFVKIHDIVHFYLPHWLDCMLNSNSTLKQVLGVITAPKVVFLFGILISTAHAQFN